MVLKIRLNDMFLGYISNITTENSQTNESTQTFSGQVSNPASEPTYTITLTRLETYQAESDQKSASSPEIIAELERAHTRSDNVLQVVSTVNDLTLRELFSGCTLTSDNNTYDPASPLSSEISLTAKKYKKSMS